ncbi:MAG TPA: helix-turn-helix domain-containing protein [Polyangiaceae bacterium]|nr:helix-turn-helix domain-containing protein [Polyangiaceae bacterium]
MHAWRTEYDPKSQIRQHSVQAGFGHSLLAPLTTYVFSRLRVAAAVWEHGHEWWPLHTETSLSTFEAQHGRDQQRLAYNTRQFALVQKKKQLVRGEHGGYSDFFAPIVVQGKVVAVLVTGPFANAPPKSADILESWRSLTGRQGHPADPEFASYLSAVFDVLVLEGSRMQALQSVLECVTRLMAGTGLADELTNQVEVSSRELEQARSSEHSWETVRIMLDERSSLRWSRTGYSHHLHLQGFSHGVDHVLVGLAVSDRPGSDPVDEAVRRHAFQRAAVELARSVGDALSGQVGDHGVVFLSGSNGGQHKKRQKVRDLAERATSLAKKSFGLALHFGLSPAASTAPLSRSYQTALGAAESALNQRVRLVNTEDAPSRSIQSLRHLRQELDRIPGERPELLPACFDRYIEAVGAQLGFRIEPTQAHLELGFERMADSLQKSGMLDEKELRAAAESLARAAAASTTVSDLFAAYRRVVLDVVEAVAKPVPARRDRSLRVAIDFIQQHYTEPLSAGRVARVAGFTRTYFSKLFKEREQMTFEHYLRALRVERAKHLLTSTDLGVGRLAKLSGFSSSEYFARIFRREVGVSPLEYRKTPAKAAPKRHRAAYKNTKQN